MPGITAYDVRAGKKVAIIDPQGYYMMVRGAKRYCVSGHNKSGAKLVTFTTEAVAKKYGPVKLMKTKAKKSKGKKKDC